MQPGEHQHDENLWLRAFDMRSHFQDNCSVCELLVSLLPANSSGPWRICWAGFGRWSSSPDQATWAVRDEFLNWDFLRAPGIVVGPDEPAAFDLWWKERHEYGLVLPTRKAGEDTSLPRARCLDARSVDFDAAKSWIKACERLHSTTCGGVQQAIEGLKVIDCRTKRVVAAPATCQYVVLSYSRETNGIAEPEDLPEWDSIPALFRDALAATSELGFDYIWIDRYCALQEASDWKEGQWRHIDKVYSEAQLTIVAACADDTSIGLSGVGEHARQQSTLAVVGDSKLVAMYWRELDSVADSKWKTEGFGYEQCLLSRRRLTFTNQGLLFQCSGDDYIESYATEAFDMALGASELRASGNCPVVFSDLRFANQFPEMIWSLLKSYTKRTQPHQPDSLGAFNAILNKLTSISKEFDHIWAVPVYQRPVHMPVAEGMTSIAPPKVRQTYAERLASRLVWEATDASDRRHGFPTWSWASLTAVIESEDYNIRNLDLDMSIEAETGGKVLVDDLLSRPAEQRPKVGKGLYFDGPTTFIELEAPLVRNGWYIPVTSFERNDSIKVRSGLRAMKHWDKELVPGRYLTLILGASQATRTSWLTYHMLVLKEKDGYYERAFPLKVKDADLNNGVPEETWSGWMEESAEVLGLEKVPWIYEDFPADFGFEKSARDDWNKVFLIAKHLRIERREVLVR